MISIKNTASLNAETLFNLLKKNFTDYINYKLDAGMNVEFAHAENIINVMFPEVIEGIAFSIVVTEKELSVTDNHVSPEYNSGILEQQLVDFLILKAS
jgi:hypothetical protein